MVRTRPPQKKEIKRRSRPGRKGVYDHTCPQRAFELCSIGLTNEKLAVAFGVKLCTIELWMRDHEEFRDAVLAGRDEFDHGVEKTLLQRAMGYEYDEIRHREGVDSQGRPYSYTTTTVKRVLPDVTAMIFWLKNRHKDRWADVHKQEITSNVNLNIPSTEKISHLLDKEEIQYARKIAKLKLKQVHGISSN